MPGHARRHFVTTAFWGEGQGECSPLMWRVVATAAATSQATPSYCHCHATCDTATPTTTLLRRRH